VVGGPAGQSGLADRIERLADPLPELGPAQPEVGRPEADVLFDRRHEELIVGILEDEPEPPPDLGQCGLLQPQPADLDRSGLGGEHPDQQQEQ
jgi:hypothetical protein